MFNFLCCTDSKDSSNYKMPLKSTKKHHTVKISKDGDNDTKLHNNTELYKSMQNYVPLYQIRLNKLNK